MNVVQYLLGKEMGGGGSEGRAFGLILRFGAGNAYTAVPNMEVLSLLPACKDLSCCCSEMCWATSTIHDWETLPPGAPEFEVEFIY